MGEIREETSRQRGQQEQRPGAWRGCAHVWPCGREQVSGQSWRSSQSWIESEDRPPPIRTGGRKESKETKVSKFVGLMAES